MKSTWKGFVAYAFIGVANTLIHWQIFYVLHSGIGLSQRVSNFTAFCFAASFSFYVNALYTFESQTSVGRYLLFISFMGLLSLIVGAAGDYFELHGLLTLVIFSGVSLVCGFLFSRLVVFREGDR